MKVTKAVRRLAALLAPVMLLLAGCTDNMAVLDPKGPIAAQQRDLMIISTILCCIVVVPVLLLTAFIVWRYRDREGRKAAYTPRWEHSFKLEAIWWGIPIVIILILAVITVKGTYALEPSKPLESAQKPLTVQVTSLNWKWLFQYPEQGIATVNELKIPQGVPVRFEITADSPMNSFWIPQLGGQMYAMSGMAMTLYLQADEAGEYWGSGANFTGTHFSSMYFDVESTTQTEFDQWVKEVQAKSPALTSEGYKQLAQPSTEQKLTFSSFPEGLFERTVTKYASGHHHSPQLKEQEPADSKTPKPASHSGHSAEEHQ
ncbi:ubiquinol oxidase subunit II [Paenibacillus radicis (ex Gao et al. 2016)]|uniref:Quinol oxidase subunit 2 n=1 Tax=Paenibacillus radicis (ex Gao et al. 2016) TaxID=1737354 RepID=A0A917LV83_9BACL|nr:ubiquinol oxidase subunit II [Paenibacillus radicis (ex Gao et al. 2016)]GGG59616.1 ubiquinol oxidase subunit 2 [Paenibacillus radicis (ex Gao et al. 2016)]